jgi:hypothetical protein
MPLSSWLFIRNAESIWIERPYGCCLIVAGPGSFREQREFPTEEALQAYQVATAETLSAAGWFLWAFNKERRQATDRRTTLRDAADRRKNNDAGS